MVAVNWRVNKWGNVNLKWLIFQVACGERMETGPNGNGVHSPWRLSKPRAHFWALYTYFYSIFYAPE